MDDVAVTSSNPVVEAVQTRCRPCKRRSGWLV